MSISPPLLGEILLPVLVFTQLGLAITLANLLVKRWLQIGGSFSVSLDSLPDKSLLARFGETLLHCLRRAALSIPSPCGGKGTCHQCRVRVLEGGGEVSSLERSVFSPEEIKDGWRLACQVKLKEEATVSIPGGALTSSSFSGSVVKNRNVSTFIKELVVVLDEPLDYESGEYLQVDIPNYMTTTSSWRDGIHLRFHQEWDKYGMLESLIIHESEEPCVRAYSLASHPGEGNAIRFTIRIASPPLENGSISSAAPWGIGSSFLFSRREGDRLSFSGPFGESKMIHDERRIYFLIGGAGASFGRSHIMSLFHLHHTKRHVELWYGARSLCENIYAEEFQALEKQFKNFRYHLVLSEPTEEDVRSGWPIQDSEKTGFLFQAFEASVLSSLKSPSEALYYVCGPPLHNQAVSVLLREYGVPKPSIVLDDFGS
ncbi:NADH:ubiquinone reductase (Na(+)-transporting) subunit F [Candidatus Similichlamydia laticola]|nr:NADH:ubiquinone reductase (Na(+)-transporting) subunit F [Candidatus Similichlamydia laticola]